MNPLPLIADYWRRSDAERTLVLEIERLHYQKTNYYCSNTPYVTEASDSPPSTLFASVIGDPGLPELKRSISQEFDGSASTSFGDVTLKDLKVPYRFDLGALKVNANGALLRVNANSLLSLGYGSGLTTAVLRRGARVTGKIVPPRRLYPYSSARTLFVGQIARVGGDSDRNVTIEIIDQSDLVKRAAITIAAYPLCFGRCRNVTPFVLDPNTMTYAVHDGRIRAILAIYDQGVQLSPSQYSVDLVNGRFTLLGPQPAGTVTADVEGHVDASGNWLFSTADICAELLRRGIVTITQNYKNMMGGTIGLYLDKTEDLDSLLTSLFRGCGAYWLVDALGVFRGAALPSLGSLAPIYDEVSLLEKIDTRDDDRLYRNVRFSYRKNWTKLQAKVGATAAQADFAQRDFLESSVDAATYDSEYVYTPSERIDTYFDDLGAGENIARVWLSTFGKPRKWGSTVLPYSETRDLGDPVGFSAGGKNYFGAVTGITEVQDGKYPRQKIEFLA